MDNSTARYRIEPWPEPPATGMLTGTIPAGVKVTDLVTGRMVVCNQERHQYKNREAAIRALEVMAGPASPSAPSQQP